MNMSPIWVSSRQMVLHVLAAGSPALRKSNIAGMPPWFEPAGTRLAQTYSESCKGQDAFREGFSQTSINAFAVEAAVYPRAILALCRKPVGDEGLGCRRELRSRLFAAVAKVRPRPNSKPPMQTFGIQPRQSVLPH